MCDEIGIIKTIIREHFIPVVQLNEYIYYLNQIQSENSKRFDIHCNIISKLSDDEFDEYIHFLYINCMRKSM